MKRTWNIVSFLAIVNLLTILLLIAWMWQTERLTEERISSLRTWVMSPPGADVPAPMDSSVEEDIESQDAMIGLSSQQRLEWLEHWRMQSEQRLQSLVDEAERRSLEVQSRLTDLELQRQELAAREQAIDDLATSQAALQADEAFQRTVLLYQSARPSTAKAWLLALIDEGRLPRAVEYLSAMDARSASKVLQAFNTGNEIKLAKQLLESMSGAHPIATAEGLPSDAHAHIQPGSTP